MVETILSLILPWLKVKIIIKMVKKVNNKVQYLEMGNKILRLEIQRDLIINRQNRHLHRNIQVKIIQL